MSRVSRLYAIAETLRARAPRLVTVAELARIHEVSVRTIQRDLQALMEAGIPVRWQDGRGGGWTVDKAMSLPPINLTEDEAAALLLAVRAASGATPLWGSAQSAWGKLSDALDAAGSDLVQRWSQLVAVREVRPGRADIVHSIENALTNRHALRLSYSDADGVPSDRIVEPYGLLASAGHWYLIAWCRTREAGRGFRLDRIISADETSDTIEPRDLHASLRDDGIPLATEWALAPAPRQRVPR